MELHNNIYAFALIILVGFIVLGIVFYFRNILSTPVSKNLFSLPVNIRHKAKIINVIIAFQLFTILIPWILYYAISGSYLRSIETFLLMNVMVLISMLLLVETKRAS